MNEIDPVKAFEAIARIISLRGEVSVKLIKVERRPLNAGIAPKQGAQEVSLQPAHH